MPPSDAGGRAARAAPRPLAHVVLIDGTMASLVPGQETSVGLIWRLLDARTRHSLHYEPGLEWRGWRRLPEVMAGVGINAQIRRAYLWLAARYRPGDAVFLVGYSRGAYAARALAGMIDRVGLLRPEHATEEAVALAYAHYRDDPMAAAARSFAHHHCHAQARIAAVAVFDTVQAVGIRWPLLWRLFPRVHAFRSHRLGRSVARGFHAMALDETRRAYALERWRTHGWRTGSVEQVWFRGTHADVGGQVGLRPEARPLANVPLAWMLGRLEDAGLALPGGWAGELEVDASAPSVGNWRGFRPLFLSRRRRAVGLDPSESVHPTAAGRRGTEGLPVWGGERGREAEAAE